MIKVATNVNATKISWLQPMNADFTSDVIDFKEMTVGSIQFKWENNDALNGKIIIESSNIDNEAWYGVVKGGIITLSEDGVTVDADGVLQKKCQTFNLGVIGYRYARLRYLKGANTAGTISFIGLGKKNG